jgi:hypothetical protein
VLVVEAQGHSGGRELERIPDSTHTGVKDAKEVVIVSRGAHGQGRVEKDAIVSQGSL